MCIRLLSNSAVTLTGQWLCRPCGDGTRPTCVLCPNLGGAMKCTPSGHKWAHVSCVLWIPEVSIGCAEKMEPITKISSIPASRWSLVCVLCRERKGACIQCSVKTCKTAYHVTCAFKHGLEMRAIIEDENADDGVKLRSYCQKHSVNSKKEKCPGSGSEEEEVKRKRRKDMTSEEKTQARAARLQEIEREFDRHVSVKDISTHLIDVDQDAITYIYNYWKLKRRAGHNRPLLPPKSDDNELLTHRQEQADLDKMRMFVQLRQDLERVRNLCYMVSRREKLSRSFFRMREQTFHKQVAVLTTDLTISGPDLAAIIEANHGPSIYDRLYSHADAIDHKNDFDALIARIAPQYSSDEKKKDRNGLVKRKKANPYKKHYVNGSRRSGSIFSGLSSEESSAEISRSSRYRARAIGSSTEEDVKKPVGSPKKKVSPKAAKGKKSPRKNERKKKKVPQSKALVESSSEEETIKSRVVRVNKDKSRSKTLQQLEKEMTAGKSAQSATDSDDLITMKSTRNNKFPVDIYSDSSEDTTVKKEVKTEKDKIKSEKVKTEKTKPAKSPKENDSQQPPRTKGAMKEFIPTQPEKKTPVKEEEKPAPKKRGRKPSSKDKKTPVKTQESDDEAKDKENIKSSKQKDNPTDLIVPQRQAAKKASENMRSTTIAKKEEPSEKQVSGDDAKSKPKVIKSKGKEVKEVVAAKVGRKKSTKEVEKEPIAYVPQRQAAKKAAAHIKSGLGSKPAVSETAEGDKKKDDKTETTKMSPKKEDVKTAKTPQKESSSSSSNSSSSSYSSSSSSDEEQEKPGAPKPTAKAREIKPVPRPPSMFSPPGTRPTVDLPFLDKVSRPLSSTSASSDTDSSKGSRFSESGSPSPKRPRRRRKGKSISTEGKSLSTDASPRKGDASPTKAADASPGKAPGSPAHKVPELSARKSTDASPRKSTDASPRKGTDLSPRKSTDASPRKAPDASPRKAPDASPRKAPDKKLKTSERRSECRVPSPTAEGEEPSRTGDARATARARTRSTTSGGNMPHKSDARQRKSSKDDSGLASGPNKTPKESRQPCELSSPERKTDEKVKKDTKKDASPAVRSEAKTKSAKSKKISEPTEEKAKPVEMDAPQTRVSPRKSTDSKQKGVSNRRMSVKEPPPPKEVAPVPVETRDIDAKERRPSRHDNKSSDRTSASPAKKPSPAAKPLKEADKKAPTPINDEFPDTDKHWLPKAASPSVNPPPVEKAGGHEKYMTEDKSLDSDSADKSSIKMIAKIQANLNENTMIKSPKTPMDARTMEPMDVDNPVVRNMRKRSSLDPEKKFITQDGSHVQGFEISKSAKIPSAVNPFSSRSMFSPQAKENELFEFDMLDDGFNHDDMMKPFSAYPEFIFKEDSKEQGVQETLNLVDRLRMQLSSKKVPAENSAQDDQPVNDDKERRDEQNNLPPDPARPPDTGLVHDEHDRSPPKDTYSATNHLSQNLSTDMHSGSSVMHQDDQPIPMTSNKKWADPPTPHDLHSDHLSDRRKYEHPAYSEDGKEPPRVQTDVHSMSEVGDTMSLSKQSDDSQPLSVVDHSVHSNDPDVMQDNHNYDNNNSLIHSDCATISSPYVSREAKWRESKITTRRSSASSTNSEGSICSQKTEMKSHMNCESLQSNVMPQIDSYPPIPAYSCPVEPARPLNQYSSYPPDASPFLNTLPLFGPGACASAQLTLPSPGPGMYAPGLPYTPPLLSKPTFPMCAAFTTSSQNIALTTAMIAPPTPKPMDSPRDDIDVTGSDKFSIHVASSPSVSADSYNDTSNRASTKMSNDSNETVTNLHISQESKSPAKPKVMSKFPVKSPGKSPAMSPKQNDPPKGTKRSSNRSNRSQRGRGRSKSRGQAVHGYSVDYMGNSIQSKLVGTVYDFDEEIANDGVDLKALRERRKSIDVRDDRASEHSYKDASQSPRVVSPPPRKRPSPLVAKEANSPTPEPAERAASPLGVDGKPGFSQVQPLLPGPVDMRTYHPFDSQVPAPAQAPAPASAPAPAPGPAYHHLLDFASGTADQQLPDIDEEDEKQLHSALMANKPAAGSPKPPPTPQVAAPKEPFIPQLPKVSLSDSRNQLKVKIKGPFLDANYSSSVQPAAPQPAAPALDPAAGAAPGAGASAAGSTNLRRMRKKELLRQYWTQDMNMDDPANASSTGVAPPPAALPTLARAVITIPKAVASMTSIPTREDYKIIDSPIEKKKRKTTSGLSRELRHLEVSMNDEPDPAEEAKLASLAASSSQAHKRRAGRKPARNPTSPLAPKLKIKIGSNVVQQVTDETAGFQFRPPKKRLVVPVPKPSLEDLRRDCMKYRKMVMADFEENEKTKKYKPTKSEKRKKKKDKRTEKLRVINSESESATKLIIKIKRAKEEASASEDTGASASGRAAAAAAAASAEPAVDPFEYDPTAPDPLAIDPPSYSEASSAMRKIRTAKVTPIRLKLARSSQGSGYVMKEAGAVPPPATAPAPAPAPAPAEDALPPLAAVNKHCEVR